VISHNLFNSIIKFFKSELKVLLIRNECKIKTCLDFIVALDIPFIQGSSTADFHILEQSLVNWIREYVIVGYSFKKKGSILIAL
jgi:hypothetical protein